MTAKDTTIEEILQSIEDEFTASGEEADLESVSAAIKKHATKLRAALLPFDASANWLPIEGAPKGKKLILGYRNQLGKWRTIMGTYYLPKTLESDLEEDVPEDEDGYAQAGWYEEYESQQGACPVEFPPTHYMPLYAAPEVT